MRITDVALAGSGSAFALHRTAPAARSRMAVPGHYNVLNAAAATR